MTAWLVCPFQGLVVTDIEDETSKRLLVHAACFPWAQAARMVATATNALHTSKVDCRSHSNVRIRCWSCRVQAMHFEHENPCSAQQLEPQAPAHTCAVLGIAG